MKVIVCNFTDYNFGQVSCLPYWMPRVLLSGSQFWHGQQHNRVIKPRGLLYNSCSSFLYWNRLWYRYLLRFRISWLKILFWTLAFILLKTGRHCLQLAWVVQLVVQLASEIPDLSEIPIERKLMKFIACRLRNILCSFFEVLCLLTCSLNISITSVFFQEILVEVNRYEVWTGQKLLDFTGGQEFRDSASEASDS